MSASESASSAGGVARSSVSMAIATFLSRLLGLARDVAVGHVLGARWVADSFFVALKIPNLLRQLLGEGAMSNAFIPVFTEYFVRRGERDAWRLARSVMCVLAAVLFILTVLGIIFAPWIVRLISLSWTATGRRFELTVLLTRIMFPYLFFIGLAALFMGMLNARGYFFAPAFAPAIMNIFVIAGAAVCILRPGDLVSMAVAIAIAEVGGGCGQLLFQVPALRKAGFSFGLEKIEDGVIRIAWLMIPATVGQSVIQVGLLVDTMIAWSLGEGAVSALYYANRLMQFPLGVLGISISQASVPEISRLVAENRNRELKVMLSELLSIAAFVMIPATIGLSLLAYPATALIYKHGRFDEASVALTSSVLVFFTLGLFFYTSVKILVPVFYAFNHTRIPVQSAMVSVLVNIILNLLLKGPLGACGLALATALASLVNMVILVVKIRQFVGNILEERFFSSFIKTVLASLFMGTVVYFVRLPFEVSGAGMTGMVWRLHLCLEILLAIFTGILSYCFAAKVTGSPELRLVINQLLKRRFSRNTS